MVSIFYGGLIERGSLINFLVQKGRLIGDGGLFEREAKKIIFGIYLRLTSTLVMG